MFAQLPAVKTVEDTEAMSPGKINTLIFKVTHEKLVALYLKLGCTCILKKQTESYTETLRKEAIRRTEAENMTAVMVAKETGIHVNQIYTWQ